MSFTANWLLTLFLGIGGILINVDKLMHLEQVFNADESEVKNALTKVGLDIISEGKTYVGQQILQATASAAVITSHIVQIANASTHVGRLLMILKYVFKHYLPGLIKGAFMLIGSLLYRYGSQYEIGLWWSKYNIITSSIY